MGSRMHVLFWVHESRRGVGTRRRDVRQGCPSGLGGCRTGGVQISGLDQSQDKRVED